MNTIYHYTDLNGFLNIIKNKKLWLSDARNLNDSHELDWFNNKLDKKIENTNFGPFNDVMDKFRDEYKDHKTKQYICSFSKEADLLSQWRAYSEDGSGVSIGFNDNAFVDLLEGNDPLFAPKTSIRLKDVDYEESAVNIQISKIVESVKSLFIELEDKKHKETIGKAILHAFTLPIFNQSSCFKNSAFKEENEVRLIYMQCDDLNQFEYISDVDFRVSAGTITSYVDFTFPKESVVEIVLGPKCKMSESDLELFLRSNKIKAKIRTSTASYR